MRFLVSTVVAVVGVGVGVHGATLFVDDFNAYSDGPLVGQGPWTERATGTTLNVASGRVAVGPVGQDAVAPIVPAISFGTGSPAQTDGYVYFVGADINLSAAQAGGDYFLHTSGGVTSSSFQGRVYARASGSGFVLGTAVTSNAPTYGTTELSFGINYRVVLRYEVIPGASNDTVSIYVDPGLVEPATAYASNTQSTAGDASALGAVNIRQGATANAPTLTLDNLVVADDFASAAVIPEPTSLGLLFASGLLLLRRR